MSTPAVLLPPLLLLPAAGGAQQRMPCRSRRKKKKDQQKKSFFAFFFLLLCFSVGAYRGIGQAAAVRGLRVGDPGVRAGALGTREALALAALVGAAADGVDGGDECEQKSNVIQHNEQTKEKKKKEKRKHEFFDFFFFFFFRARKSKLTVELGIESLVCLVN
jgi:hypothetical protein